MASTSAGSGSENAPPPDDFENAARMREVIRQMVREELGKERPKQSYAVVAAVDTNRQIAYVIFPGETERVPVSFGSSIPLTEATVGVTVRIGGTAGDRYIEDVHPGEVSVATVASLQAEIDRSELIIASNTSAIGANALNIATNAAAIVLNTDAINDNADTLASHTSTLSSHTSTLSSHTSTLSSHTSTLASHASDLSTHASQINQLQNREFCVLEGPQQTVASDTWVTFQNQWTEWIDEYGMHTPGSNGSVNNRSIRPLRRGYHRVSVRGYAANNAGDNETIMARYLVNESPRETLWESDMNSDSSFGTRTFGSEICFLLATDYVYVQMQQFTGQNLTMQVERFTLEYLSDG